MSPDQHPQPHPLAHQHIRLGWGLAMYLGLWIRQLRWLRSCSLGSFVFHLRPGSPTTSSSGCADVLVFKTAFEAIKRTLGFIWELRLVYQTYDFCRILCDVLPSSSPISCHQAHTLAGIKPSPSPSPSSSSLRQIGIKYPHFAHDTQRKVKLLTGKIK